MHQGLAQALCGSIPGDSLHQATIAVDAGGSGMRETKIIAPPASLASRVHARPLVAEMALHTDAAGICPMHLFMSSYDDRQPKPLLIVGYSVCLKTSMTKFAISWMTRLTWLPHGGIPFPKAFNICRLRGVQCRCPCCSHGRYRRSSG